MVHATMPTAIRAAAPGPGIAYDAPFPTADIRVAAPDKSGPRLRALIYARCSTSDQDYSRQAIELRQDAERAGWEVVDVLGRYVSGGANDSDLNRIRAWASRREFDVLMVWELSRLSRKGPGAILVLLTQLEAWGVRVFSHAEPWVNVDGPARELLISVLGWVARWEREQISARTKSAMAARKRLGVHVGRPLGAKDKRPRKRPAKRGTLAALEERAGLEKGPLFD
jgi:DNA invertase Pin-like site-specific DNA recombinase